MSCVNNDFWNVFFQASSRVCLPGRLLTKLGIEYMEYGIEPVKQFRHKGLWVSNQPFFCGRTKLVYMFFF